RASAGGEACCPPGGRDRPLLGDGWATLLRRTRGCSNRRALHTSDQECNVSRGNGDDNGVETPLGGGPRAGEPASAVGRARGRGRAVGRSRGGALVRRLLPALLGLGLACGAASVASAAPAPANPLAPLVLPRAQLGKLAQGFEVELLSGSTTNGRAADDSFDPNDTPAEVTKAGRVSGYTLVYGDVGFGALRKGNGLIDIGTSLDYFRSIANAESYELKSLRDMRRVQGQNLQGVVVERSSAFPVQGL